MNIQMEKTDEYRIYEQKCKKLLALDEIRFAGLINNMGHLVAGGFTPGISPREDDAEGKKMYMALALRASMRKEFDSSLGPVKYAASRREKTVMLSFPIDSNILLVSAEPNVDIDKTANKIINLIGIK